MKLIVQIISVLSSATILHTAADQGKCYQPQLYHGRVEAEEGKLSTIFQFLCNPGYTLSGPPTLKCHNGNWSGRMPVCSVGGCDPSKIPALANGRVLSVRGARNSVFKYKCNRG